ARTARHPRRPRRASRRRRAPPRRERSRPRRPPAATPALTSQKRPNGSKRAEAAAQCGNQGLAFGVRGGDAEDAAVGTDGRCAAAREPRIQPAVRVAERRSEREEARAQPLEEGEGACRERRPRIVAGHEGEARAEEVVEPGGCAVWGAEAHLRDER